MFPIKLRADLRKTQKLVYRLVDDLTGKVLNSTIKDVDLIIKKILLKKLINEEKKY
ncbi:MAG: hypothetical protein VB130_08495 [Clostridium sp.]|nr:hypothetical protein [Clostridium sp.]